jgi:proline dehydrogenase
VLRALVLAAARSEHVRSLVTHAPVSRGLVRRFVAGSTVDDAIATTRDLQGEGLQVSLDHLGEDTTEPGQAEAGVQAYLLLLQRLRDAGLSARAEVSAKLTAVGLEIDRQPAVDNAGRIAAAAAAAGTTLTLDMEGSGLTEATLSVLRELRRGHPSVGGVLQAMLRRTEADAASLAGPGSRIRLCKGAYAEPAEIAYQDRAAVDASYARCLGVLMRGQGYPMVATHDPRLIDLAIRLADRVGRSPDSWELQMLYGVRPGEQLRLAQAGHTVRVYVPYGAQWYGYLMRRLAERPSNLAFLLRAVATRG